MDTRKARISIIMGNIVICATVAALLFVTATPFTAKPVGEGVEPYYSGNSDSCVSLMVNVYWGTEYIKPMLEIFERHGAKTTFFVGGSWAVANEKTLKEIADAGHELGNHGYYHKDHKKLDAEYNRKEIQSAHDDPSRAAFGRVRNRYARHCDRARLSHGNVDSRHDRLARSRQ